MTEVLPNHLFAVLMLRAFPRPEPGLIYLRRVIAGRRGVAIRAIKIIVYSLAFVVVIAVAAAIALLSIAVAPGNAKTGTLSLIAISLGGLGVAGGVVYLAEKLISLAKGVAYMVAEIIVEKYKQHREEIGRKKGRKEGRLEGRHEGRAGERQAWLAWYQRQQAARKEGREFTEPPPGLAPED